MTLQPPLQPAEEHHDPAEAVEQNENAIELKEVEGLSQGRIVLRRFVRHRGAMISAFVLLFVIVLVTTSIGWGGPIPGWWKYDYRELNPITNAGGAPTMGGWHDAASPSGGTTRSGRTTSARTASRSSCAARSSRSP